MSTKLETDETPLVSENTLHGQWLIRWIRSGKSIADLDKRIIESLNLQKKMPIGKSKTFVIIVGANTKNLTIGACRYCTSYNWGTCSRYYSVDNRSYIEYECEKAVRDNLKIVVIYNYANVDKRKCPDCIRYYGVHVPAYYYAGDGKCYWNIAKIKEAINGQ